MFWAAVRKDILLLRRDRGALAGLFALPILFIAVFGNVLSSDPAEARWPIAVWSAPGSALGARVVSALERSRGFAPEAAASPEEVRARVASGERRLGLILAADFDPVAGRPAELVIDEAAAPQVRAPIEGSLAALAGGAIAGAPADLVVLEARTPPGIRRPLAHTDGFQLAVPGNAVLFCFFLSVTVALSFVVERRTGTWRRLLSAPVHRSSLLVAKLVPYFLVGLVQMALFFAVGAWGFGMAVGGSVAALALLTIGVCAASVSLGLLLASFARTEKQVGGLGSLIVLTMGLVGGCMYPRLAMPELMQDVGRAVPHAWALDGYYEILIRDGAGILDILPQLAGLVGFTLLFAAIAIAKGRLSP